MNETQRLHLQNMIAANNVEDNTELIRQLRHSHILREDVNNLIMLKAKYCSDGLSSSDLHLEAMTTCNFLFTYYTDIYNKIRNDEIDLTVLYKALDVLRDIEDGKLEMHSGAYEFGLLLKHLYVDSALKKAEKLDANAAQSEPAYKGPQVNISWSEYKRMSKKTK